MLRITDIRTFSCPELEGKSPEMVFAPFSAIPGSSLLLSGGAGDSGVSVIGLYPAAVVHDRNNRPVIETGSSAAAVDDPFDTIEQILSGIPDHGDGSFRFGALGYISYDYRTRIELLPDNNPGPDSLPDVCFTFPAVLLL